MRRLPPSTADRGRVAQSFRIDEVKVMIDIMAKLMRGDSAEILMQSDAARNVYGKFVRMKLRLAEKQTQP